MNNYLQKKDFKLISTKVILLCLFLAIGSSKAFSQCNYVITENGEETKLSIPCDFPVYLNTDNTNFDKNTFKIATQNWFSKDAYMIELKARLAKSQKLNLEIPLVEYNKFSSEKKNVIDKNPSFYKIVQSNK